MVGRRAVSGAIVIGRSRRDPEHSEIIVEGMIFLHRDNHVLQVLEALRNRDTGAGGAGRRTRRRRRSAEGFRPVKGEPENREYRCARERNQFQVLQEVSPEYDKAAAASSRIYIQQ